MINGYTESEICTLYRSAKNKKLQINILTQLTGLMDFQIIEILEKGGYLVADIEKLKQLHAEGLTIRAIGEELGIGQSTVNYHMKKLGLKPNGKGRKKKEVTKKNVEELKEILPKSIPAELEDLSIDYELADGALEKVTAQQYYELAKITLQLLKLIWEG